MSHDNAYKLLFSEPQIVIDLLQGFVHEPWVADLDFSSLEKVSTHHVADTLHRRENDVIWRVKCQNQWLYVYLLIEFQSRIDYFMAVRIVTYIGLLYQDLIKQQKLGKKDKLPPVFPIVLYNGKPRWSASTELSTLIHDLPHGFNHYKPSLRYLLLDEGRYRVDTLHPLKNLVAAIFRLEQAKTHQDMIAVIDDLLQWLTQPEQASIHRAFNIWIKRVLRINKKITEPIDNVNDLIEVKTMLAETIANWPKEWQAKGRVEGRVEGRLEGKAEGMKTMLQRERLLFKRMIDKRFGKTIAESAWFFLQTIEKIEDLEKVSDWLLDCETGENFLACFKQH